MTEILKEEVLELVLNKLGDPKLWKKEKEDKEMLLDSRKITYVTNINEFRVTLEQREDDKNTSLYIFEGSGAPVLAYPETASHLIKSDQEDIDELFKKIHDAYNTKDILIRQAVHMTGTQKKADKIKRIKASLESIN